MGEKKKKEGKRKETRKERERGTTKHRIRGRRIIDESSTNKRNQRDEVHQDLHAHTRFVRCTYTYIHTHVEKTRQNDASPISRIERARVHNISHDPCYPNRFFVSGAILSRNEAR